MRYASVKEKEWKKGQRHKVFEVSFDAKECNTNKFVYQESDYMHKNPVSKKWLCPAGVLPVWFHNKKNWSWQTPGSELLQHIIYMNKLFIFLNSLFIKWCAGIFIICKIIYQLPSFANWIMMYVFYFFKNKFHWLTFFSIKPACRQAGLSSNTLCLCFFLRSLLLTLL